MAKIGPVIFTVAGDSYLDGSRGGRINAIIWEAQSTAGDLAELRDLDNESILWRGRATGSQTYLGANIGESGIHAPYGFYASRLDSGTLMIYLRED